MRVSVEEVSRGVQVYRAEKGMSWRVVSALQSCAPAVSAKGGAWAKCAEQTSTMHDPKRVLGATSDVYRHSVHEVLAQAVLEAYERAQIWARGAPEVNDAMMSLRCEIRAEHAPAKHELAEAE